MKWLIPPTLILLTTFLGGCGSTPHRVRPPRPAPRHSSNLLMIDDLSPTVSGQGVYRQKGQAAPAARSGNAYVIQPGDTLYAIAQRFYQDPAMWRTIAAANRNAIPDPNRIVIGTTIQLPSR